MKKPYTKCPNCGSPKFTTSVVGKMNGIIISTFDYYCIDCKNYWNGEELCAT